MGPAILVFLFFASVGGVLAALSIQTLRELSDPQIAAEALATRGSVRGTGDVVAMIVLASLMSLGGFGVLSSPWFARAAARRTVYAVTSTRVFILVRKPSGRIRTDALEPGHPLAISRREHADGSGDVVIHPRPKGQAGGLLTLAATSDPRTVERLIRQTFDPPPARAG